MHEIDAKHNMENLPFLPIVKSLLPSDASWHIEEDEPYVFVRPHRLQLQQQGWKIFVSAQFFNASAVIRRASRVCVDLRMPFKFIKSRFSLATEILAKHVLPAEGAKAVVIYPRNPQNCHTVLCTLSRALESSEAPPVLSGRRFSKNAPVYYRYGAHRGIFRDGAVYLRNPETRQLVPDRIQPWYEAPAWIHTDPFQPDLTDDTSEVEEAEIVLQDGRYAIQEAIFVSNSGGVFLAKDSTTHQLYCLKEARPFFAPNPSTGEDSVSRLVQEAATLRECNRHGLAVAPTFIDYFIEEDHAFLVRSFIEGETLFERKARQPFSTGELAQLQHALESILELSGIRHFKDRNLDLSPQNIIYDGETITVIDFETDPADNFGTPGFIPPLGVPCKWRWSIQALLDFCANDPDG